MGRYKSIYTLLQHKSVAYIESLFQSSCNTWPRIARSLMIILDIMEACTVAYGSHWRSVPLAHVSLDLVGLSKPRPHHFAFWVLRERVPGI